MQFFLVEEYGEFRCCGNSMKAVERRCQIGIGGQTTSCGLTGPAGCAVCWTADFNSSGCSAGATHPIDTYYSTHMEWCGGSGPPQA